MPDPNPPYREPNKYDYPCQTCGEKMVGVIKPSKNNLSDFKVARENCIKCVKEGADSVACY